MRGPLCQSCETAYVLWFYLLEQGSGKHRCPLLSGPVLAADKHSLISFSTSKDGARPIPERWRDTVAPHAFFWQDARTQYLEKGRQTRVRVVPMDHSSYLLRLLRLLRLSLGTGQHHPCAMKCVLPPPLSRPPHTRFPPTGKAPFRRAHDAVDVATICRLEENQVSAQFLGSWLSDWCRTMHSGLMPLRYSSSLTDLFHCMHGASSLGLSKQRNYRSDVDNCILF